MPAQTRSGNLAIASAPYATPAKRAKTNVKTAAKGKGKGKGKSMKTLPEYWPPFRFLDLPREIRDIIYNLVLIAPGTAKCIYCCCRGHCKCRFSVSVSQRKLALQQYEPALIQTCRRIRKEGRGVFYSRNSFHVCIDNFNFIPLFGWLKLIGPDLSAALQVLDLEFGGEVGWANARHYLEVKETQLAPKVKVVLCGRRAMCAAFEAACEIGADLRKIGVSWDQIEKTLNLAQHLAVISEFNMDWPYDDDLDDCYEDDMDDMSADGHSFPIFQPLSAPW